MEQHLKQKLFSGGLSAFLLLTGCGVSNHAGPKGYESSLLDTGQARTITPNTAVEFYFYINADNDIMGARKDGSIDNQGEIVADELKSSFLNTKNFGLHIYLDRGASIHAGDSVNSETFHSCADEQSKTVLQGETDSSDPRNLAALLDQRCYPTANRFVVLWSHGDGFRPQKDFDYSPIVRSFHISTLLEAIPDGFAEAIIFDSCSMASLEVASLLERKAKWMLSSQFELPNEGIQYHTLPTLLAGNTDTLAVLRELRDSSEKKFSEIGVQAPLVILDLTKLETLRAAFSESWTTSETTRASDYDMFRNSVLRGERDGDLYFLFKKYSPQSQSALKAVLDSGRGSLHFAVPRVRAEVDPDFEAVATIAPEVFKTWSNEFPNWASYARNVPQQGVLL